MKHEIKARTVIVARMELTLEEVHTLRRGLEHDLGGAQDGLRYALHDLLGRVIKDMEQTTAAQESLDVAARKQPACGNLEPHRPHNGFAPGSHREPWCVGVEDLDEMGG